MPSVCFVNFIVTGRVEIEVKEEAGIRDELRRCLSEDVAALTVAAAEATEEVSVDAFRMGQVLQSVQSPFQTCKEHPDLLIEADGRRGANIVDPDVVRKRSVFPAVSTASRQPLESQHAGWQPQGRFH